MMRFGKLVIVLAVLCAVVIVGAATSAFCQAPARPMPLAGTLSDVAAWRAYKTRFITETGRVVDTGNGQISHSEGQGYAMLLAVAANDRDSFERVWGWTRANLLVRGDQLMAWRWEPNARPAVADMNNASDGDLLVAWALSEAAEAWSDAAYRVAARRIAVEVSRKLVILKSAQGPLLLPAISGFSADDRADGPVVNLSYWVFPALERLSMAAPEFDWTSLTRSGLALVQSARFGKTRLTAEWVSLREAGPRPAQGFAPTFSYNAIRIPLYLAWAGLGKAADYAPYSALWAQRPSAGLSIVDVNDGRVVGNFGERGYAAIADLTACAASGTRLPASFAKVQTSENYYPVTLHMLAQIAVTMRYPSCLRG